MVVNIFYKSQYIMHGQDRHKNYIEDTTSLMKTVLFLIASVANKITNAKKTSSTAMVYKLLNYIAYVIPTNFLLETLNLNPILREADFSS